MFTWYGVTMSETKQISVPTDPKLALRFGVWCKINKMTQAEGFEKLIIENVPDYYVKLQE